MNIFKSIGRYLGQIAVWADQGVNVVAAPVLNAMTSDRSYKFGNPDETLSSVMGKNVRNGTCRGCHWICKYILHPIDRNHCIESIEEDEG